MEIQLLKFIGISSATTTRQFLSKHHTYLSNAWWRYAEAYFVYQIIPVENGKRFKFIPKHFKNFTFLQYIAMEISVRGIVQQFASKASISITAKEPISQFLTRFFSFVRYLSLLSCNGSEKIITGEVRVGDKNTPTACCISKIGMALSLTCLTISLDLLLQLGHFEIHTLTTVI